MPTLMYGGFPSDYGQATLIESVMAKPLTKRQQADPHSPDCAVTWQQVEGILGWLGMAVHMGIHTYLPEKYSMYNISIPCGTREFKRVDRQIK
jgi:hypothetical protein